MKRNIWKMAAVAATLTLGMACQSDNDSSSQAPARLKFHLTDAPADYDAVLVDIEKVMVHIDDDGDSTNGGGWEELDEVNPGIYDLLQLQNGLDTLLAEDELPAGRLSQIRLVLGTNNSLVINGESKPLNTPSAQQSGLKLKVNYDLEPGLLYEFWLDFDANRSIVERGNGEYNLKPVIRVFTENNTGSMEGFVDPIAARPLIYVFNSAGDTATAIADSTDGYFLIKGLPADNYDLLADPVAPYNTVSQSQLSVSQGLVTYLDTLVF